MENYSYKYIHVSINRCSYTCVDNGCRDCNCKCNPDADDDTDTDYNPYTSLPITKLQRLEYQSSEFTQFLYIDL